MDTYSAGQWWKKIAVAVFTKPSSIFYRDGDKIFHGNLSG